MKNTLKKITLLAVAIIASAGMSAKAVVTFDNGDLILGFRATGGTGSASNLLINLGAATTYRDANNAYINIGDFSTDLSNTYGTNWATRNDIFFGIVGNFSPTLGPSGVGTITNGDGSRTIYASNSTTGFSLTSTANMGLIAQQIQSLNNVFNPATEAATLFSTVSPASTGGGWTENINNQFGPFAGLGSGFESSFSGGIGSLDLQRYVPRLDPLLTENPTTALVGVYQGTFTISSAGQISYGVVPEPSTYASLLVGGLLLFYVIRRKNAQLAA